MFPTTMTRTSSATRASHGPPPAYLARDQVISRPTPANYASIIENGRACVCAPGAATGQVAVYSGRRSTTTMAQRPFAQSPS